MYSFKRMIAAASTIALLGLSQAALADDSPVRNAGGVLVNQSDMTLYTFDKDSDGKSACNGPCAALWPPLAAATDAKPAGAYSIITRDDGAKQWAHKGKPLYLWVKDQKPGDRTGDGVNNVWHVAEE